MKMCVSVCVVSGNWLTLNSTVGVFSISPLLTLGTRNLGPVSSFLVR